MRTTRKQCESVVGLINETLGYDRERAGKYSGANGLASPGFAIYANSPGDGATRYQLHYYSGISPGAFEDCSWSYSLGAAEFYGKIVAFLRGIEETQRSLTRGEGREKRRAQFKLRFGV